MADEDGGSGVGRLADAAPRLATRFGLRVAVTLVHVALVCKVVVELLQAVLALANVREV